MDQFDAIVIGSGLGGLTAGALCAQQGMRVLVLERHTKIGGCATTFRRLGVDIEVSLHEMDGLDEDDPKRDLFEKLGLFKAMSFVPAENFYAIRHPMLGEEFIMPVGIDRCIDALVSRFPHHRQGILRYFKTLCDLREAVRFFFYSRSKTVWWRLARARHLPRLVLALVRYERETLGNFLNILFGDDEDIKLALYANAAYYTDDPATLSLVYFAAAQASYYKGGGHYIKGGSQILSNHLAAMIRNTGGVVRTRCPVDRLLVQNGVVGGVEFTSTHLAEGTTGPNEPVRERAFAPLVFGNASPHALGEMLPDDVRETFMLPYRARRASTSLWTIYLLLNTAPARYGVHEYSTFIYPSWYRSISDLPRCAPLMSEMPSGKYPMFAFVDYGRIDSGLVGGGKILCQMTGLDLISNWEGLGEETYKDRKTRWLSVLIQALDDAYPGISGSIIHKEMATARTMKRYLNTLDGSVYGFSQETSNSGRSRPDTRTTIKGLWLASAFAKPGGGFTGAMLAGENAFHAAIKKRWS